MHGNKEYLETIYIYSNDWFCSKFSSTRHAQKLKHKNGRTGQAQFSTERLTTLYNIVQGA